MKIVVVGKGGREHALAAKLASSPRVESLWVCPGNPGMQKMGLQCAPVENPEDIVQFCLAQKVSLVVIGPEGAILSNLKSLLEGHGIACFAPSPAAAELESSKYFCKQILIESKVPTAAYTATKNSTEAMACVQEHNFDSPLVVKADGLAAGKGVWVCDTQKMAEEAVQVLGTQYGYPLLMEECLVGRELSAFALCDGRDFVLLGTACDYKRITPDPFSANTGGMGAYSPCDFITPEDEINIRSYFQKTLECLIKKDLSYHGFLFMGLMKTSKGLYVLEYNVRMGDPETQALMPRLESDLAVLIQASTQHELKKHTCQLSNLTSVHVVAVSKGYPQNDMLLYQKITYKVPSESLGHLYFAGVCGKDGDLVNSGGRVLGVTSLANTKAEARAKSYKAMQDIHFEGLYKREDIAQ
jgi:phosphoribosylamine--glycine ligase